MRNRAMMLFLTAVVVGAVVALLERDSDKEPLPQVVFVDIPQHVMSQMTALVCTDATDEVASNLTFQASHGVVSKEPPRPRFYNTRMSSDEPIFRSFEPMAPGCAYFTAPKRPGTYVDGEKPLNVVITAQVGDDRVARVTIPVFRDPF